MTSLVGLMGEPLEVGDQVRYNPDPNFHHDLYRDCVGKIFTISKIERPEHQSHYFKDIYARGPMRLLHFEETNHLMYDARFLKANRDYKIDQEPIDDEECI
ncbi:hypothetical protein SmphiM6_93 [Sinorhizobium phage phiM6]|nr:hypothetical protein SmphiM6_93 [Sinorhizobium phage phiM6]